MNMPLVSPVLATALVCEHCGLPVPPDTRFCCSGCEAAFGFIQGLGLGLYYERRELDASSRILRPEDSSLPDLTRFTRDISDEVCELNLMVDGIQCGACIWLIESVLTRHDGVIRGRVNMTTRRLSLRWKPLLVQVEEVLQSIERLGYRLAPLDPVAAKAAQDRTTKNLLNALAVAGFAAGNLMLLAIGIWVGFSQGMGDATRALLHWASAIIALPAIAYAGRPFFQSAWTALKHGRTNMDVPVSIGVLLIAGMSLSETIRGGAHTYFDSAAMLLFFLLIGRVLDQRAKSRARQAAEQLLGLRVIDVTVIRPDGSLELRAQDRVRRDELVLVGIGERIGVDGIVKDGRSQIDTSIVSGESMPVPAGEGAKVFAGSLNLDGPLQICVTATGEDTLLAECVRLIEAAEQGRGRFVALADRIARLYAPVVHVAALATFLLWWLVFSAPWTEALLIAASVLIITCPCALALAVPAVQIIAAGRLFRAGILLKSPTALERLARIDTVVFDKTGTLSEPNLRLRTDTLYYKERDLTDAAAMAAASRHPLARALLAAVPFAKPVSNVEEVPGCGLRYHGRDGDYRLGSHAFCEGGIAPPATTPEIWFKRGEEAAICFCFEENLRSDADEVVSMLKERGYGLHLCSGDHEGAVAAVARKLGIAQAHAGLTPVQKVAELDALKVAGHHVMMVGDGLNDGPSLAAASVSMSPSTAADISQTIADIVFQGKGLAPVVEVLKTAKAARRLITQNISFSLAYNVVMVPLAMLGYVTPWLAAAAMSGSSIIVIVNSLRLNGSLSLNRRKA